ncbi:MAG: MarR family transcriptional regulator [Bacteroidetes bacterium]|nr:MarR family transcriptional regulator [Bacteroidota bacterium]MBS1609949.1 MarR family transcriptional regulator [Bacteroidota bacterium]
MSIDKDIHQVKFKNEYHKATVNILYTSSWLMEKIKNVLEEDDITPQQFNILRILRGSYPKPLSTLQIRERMLDKMSDTSRIVDRLILKGLVKKTVSKTDRRLVDVIISLRGRRLLEKLDVKQDDLDGILKNLSDEEAADLSKLLDKIRGTD